MMDEINKLYEDVVELNEEFGKKIYFWKLVEYFFINFEINCYINIFRYYFI